MPRETSTRVEGRGSPEGPPSRMRSTSRPRTSAASSALRTGGRPERLALVLVIGQPRVGHAKRQRGRGSEQVLREVGRRGEHEGERPGPEGVDQDFGGPWNVSHKRVQILPAPDEQDQAFLRFPALEVKDTFESGPIKRVCAQAVDGLRRVDDNAARPDPVGSLNDARLVGREDGRPSHSQNRLPGRKRVDGGVRSKALTKAMKSPNPTVPLPSRSKRISAVP